MMAKEQKTVQDDLKLFGTPSATLDTLTKMGMVEQQREKASGEVVNAGALGTWTNERGDIYDGLIPNPQVASFVDIMSGISDAGSVAIEFIRYPIAAINGYKIGKSNAEGNAEQEIHGFIDKNGVYKPGLLNYIDRDFENLYGGTENHKVVSDFAKKVDNYNTKYSYLFDYASSEIGKLEKDLDVSDPKAMKEYKNKLEEEDSEAMKEYKNKLKQLEYVRTILELPEFTTSEYHINGDEISNDESASYEIEWD